MPRQVHKYWRDHTSEYHHAEAGSGSGTMRWTCKYCGLSRSSTLTRFVKHITKIGGDGISPCADVSQDIADSIIRERGMAVLAQEAGHRSCIIADLSRPETLPATLVGVHTVIDCATGRPEEPIRKVDWDGKVALIQCAKAMGIQKYVFFSIHNCEKYPEVPLMEIKRCTEKFIMDSGLNYMIVRLCGFMQALIGQYAVPVLEEKAVWGTDAPTRIAYMDTQDIARLTLTALRNEKMNQKLLTFAGPRAWTTQEVISLCERLAGQDARVTTVPVWVLKFTRSLTRLFQWTNDVADRLAFSEVLTSDLIFSAPMAETYAMLGADAKDATTLERYLQDYYTSILKKLKDLKAQSKQGDFYI